MSQELLRKDLHEEEELSPDHALSFRQIFGQKLMSLDTAGALIKWITGLGVAQILAAVLLIGFNLAEMPAITMNRPDGTVSYVITLPVLVGCTVFMSIAWCWLVVGALHSRLLIRVPLLLFFFSLHLYLASQHGQTVTGWVVLVLAMAYVIWHGFARPRGFVRDLVVFGLGLPFLYVALVDQALLADRTGQYAALLISLQIMALSFFMMPLFIFAGLDLGESVRDVTRWMIGQVAARTHDLALIWVALGVAAVKCAWLIAAGEFTWGWVPASLAVCAIGWFTVRMKPWEGLHHEPPFAALAGGVLVAIVSLLALIAVALTTNIPDLTESALLWVFGGLGLASLAIAMLLTRGTVSADRRSAATFLGIMAIWLLGRMVTGELIWNQMIAVDGLYLDLDTLDGALTVVVGGILLFLHKRGLTNRSVAAWALSLMAGMSVVRGMYWLVENNFEVPAMTAAGQLVILAVGLLWDVLTSGNRWTNGDSPRVPRPARVLLYFGYVSMTVTAILFYKGTGQSASYDEDLFAMMGLMILGIPLFLYGFARAGVLLVRQAWERQELIG